MILLNSMRSILALWIVLILLIVVSCRTEYTGQHFSFPPGSKPYENDWEYTAFISVSSKQSPITKKSKKQVRIKVYDKSKSIFLNEVFKFVAVSIRAKVVWDKFEEIKIELLEVGNQYAEDPYNVYLMKTGPNSLLKLTYYYDQKDKKFIRID